MAFRLQVRNYRGLRAVDWSPEGVCALVGANGSGKTTLLDVPALLGDALNRGLARSLEAHGGVAHARNLYAGGDEPYYFEAALDEVSWHLAPLETERGYRSEERFVVDGKLVISREAGADVAQVGEVSWPALDRLALNTTVALSERSMRLPKLLSRYRMYGPYDVVNLRRSGSIESSERRLDRHGSNVFSVLRNWRDRSRDRARYTFVIDGLRELFPGFFEDLEFARAGQVIGADLRLPHDRVHSANLAPDGWFAALLHLAAIASTGQDDVIAIDEPENALHPRAIKLLLEHMRTWSRRYEATILLATHSPVIISDFDTRPEQLYVMQPDQPACPAPVTEIKARDWLAHFTLGDLYTREEFGAPDGDAEHRPPHDR